MKILKMVCTPKEGGTPPLDKLPKKRENYAYRGLPITSVARIVPLVTWKVKIDIRIIRMVTKGVRTVRIVVTMIRIVARISNQDSHHNNQEGQDVQ